MRYSSGCYNVDQDKLKEGIWELEENIDGANYWTISVTITSIFEGNEKNLTKLVAVLLEISDKEKLKEPLGEPLINKAEQQSNDALR